MLRKDKKKNGMSEDKQPDSNPNLGLKKSKLQNCLKFLESNSDNGQDNDIQKHYCNILAPNKNLDELLQSSFRQISPPRKESRFTTLQGDQNIPPELQLSDLSSKKSNFFVAQQTSTFERASQDAGYFATGHGEIAQNPPITQENGRSSILKSASTHKSELITLK